MKNKQFVASNLESPEVIDLPLGQVALYTHASPERGQNEDCAAVISVNANSCVLMVADGLGGHANGAAASAFFTNLLENSVGKHGDSEVAVRESILKSIEETNRNLLGKETGEGTTVAIAEITDNRIRTYHVGDSEILLTGQRGKLKLHTLSHSPVAYAVESGLIEESEALSHEDRHFVSNFVGRHGMHIAMGSPKKSDPETL